MTETVETNVTAGAWTEVASGSEFVSVHTHEDKAFAVHVGASAPVLAAPHVLGGEAAVRLHGLTAGDKVYARGATETVTLVVMRS
jgi:hypothetical protein